MAQNSKPKVALLAGTGVADLFELGRRTTVQTKFGSVSVYRSGDGRHWILPRHGARHSIPPHMINYRANMAALRKIGVERVIATSAVGSMNEGFGVGELGLVDQFIDFTKTRHSTFFDDEVVHMDMTNPYSREVNSALMKAAEAVGLRLRTGLVYVCVEGPRFETAAEIKMFRELGGDVVGMTGVPEVVLANEVGLQYSSVVIATNWGAGIQSRVSHEEVLTMMKKTGGAVKRLVEETVNLLSPRLPERTS